MFDKFIKICNMVGRDISLSQGAGGNASFKFKDIMYIKSSGIRLDDVSDIFGYTAVKYKIILKYLLEQDSFDDINKNKEKGLSLVLNSSKDDSLHKRPSMESGFHSLFEKSVLHLHPIYLNIFLCMNEGEGFLKEIFNDIEYSYIPYYSPGYNLSYFLSTKSRDNNIYFLSNHGLIIVDDDLYKCYNVAREINDKCKEFLKELINIEDFRYKKITNFKDNTFFYPDSAVFLDKEINFPSKNILEVINSHIYIKKAISKIGSIKEFGKEQVKYIRTMEAEKYRKGLS